MSIAIEKILVAKISTSVGTYYVSNRHGGVTLDGDEYQHLILSVGEAQKLGNFGEGFQIGKCKIKLMNGVEYHQGKPVFDLTAVWNNNTCVIKQCDIDNDTTWDECDWYYKGIIKNFNFNNEMISFDIDDYNSKDDKTVPSQTVEDIVADFDDLETSDIPENSKGKRVPMQFGNLNDENNGVFAKGILVSERIGNQQVYFSRRYLNELNNIGVWENGLKRYFIGRQKDDSVNPVQGEYEIPSDNRKIVFQVDSLTTLKTAIASTSSGIEDIYITDPTRLLWINEDSDFVDDTNSPELLSINVIGIDSELMLIVDKPPTVNTDPVYVERGFSDTTITTHSVGAKVYQCAKYSARNLLSFTERFGVASIANHYSDLAGETFPNVITNAGFQNIISSDTDEFMQIEKECVLNWDMKFGQIEDSYPATGWHIALKIGHLIEAFKTFHLYYYSPSETTTSDQGTTAESTKAVRVYSFDFTGASSEYTFNTWDTIFRRNPNSQWVDPVEFYISGPIRSYPNLLYESGGAPIFAIYNLQDLNKKWKIAFDLQDDTTIKLYQMGVWVDFFTAFTDKRLCGSLKGLVTTWETNIVTGTASNVVATNPVDVLAHILIHQMDYLTYNFNTTNFTTVTDYFSLAFTWSYFGRSVPSCAFSYGIDESKKGWEFCQWLASHYMLMLLKDEEGLIDIVNLHLLQNADPSYGYSTLTNYKISIDDIIIQGSSRKFTLTQTGTDRLRNDVKILYKRNNSTDEYQAEYIVPDDYSFRDGIDSLEVARNAYYNGEKTETLVIESPFIYQEDDAKNLGEWHIEDKARIHFWIEATIPNDHYTNANSKSTQYQIGDLVYFDGLYSGVTFDSTNLFVIRETVKKDQGREITLKCKSINPISAFSSNAAGQITAWQDTHDTGTEYQDTHDTGTEYQDRG